MSNQANLPTVESVTDWEWISVPTHRGKVPTMPKEERTAWNILGNQPKLTREERKLYRALTRKLQYRANREIDKSYV